MYLAALFALIVLSVPLNANTYYVSPTGSDTGSNSGGINDPFMTINHAAQIAQPGDTVTIRAGIYREEVVPKANNVTYTSYANESVTVNGTTKVTTWTSPISGNYIYTTIMPTSVSGIPGPSAATDDEQVFVDGLMMNPARYPAPLNYDVSHPAMAISQSGGLAGSLTTVPVNTNEHQQEYTLGALSDSGLPAGLIQSSNSNGLIIHLLGGSAMGIPLTTTGGTSSGYGGLGITFPVTKVGSVTWTDFTNATSFSTGVAGSSASGLQFNMSANPIVVTNAISSSSSNFTYKNHNIIAYGPQPYVNYYLTGQLSLLTAPGEWFDNNGSLNLWLPLSDSPNNHIVEVKTRYYGFDLSNVSGVMIQNINLFACTIITSTSSNSISLNHLDVVYPSHYDSIGQLYKTGETNTGIILAGTDNTITNSSVGYSAGNGVTLLGKNSIVSNCLIHDADYAGSDCAGIATGGFPTTSSSNVPVPGLTLTQLQSEVYGAQIIANTIYNSARALLQIRNLYHGVIAFNNCSCGALHTFDYGGIYTADSNGGYTRIAYNRIHHIFNTDFVQYGKVYALNNAIADTLGDCIYLDNNASHYIVDHNSTYASQKGLMITYPGGTSTTGDPNYSGPSYINVYNNTFLGLTEGAQANPPNTVTNCADIFENNISSKSYGVSQGATITVGTTSQTQIISNNVLVLVENYPDMIMESQTDPSIDIPYFPYQFPDFNGNNPYNFTNNSTYIQGKGASVGTLPITYQTIIGSGSNATLGSATDNIIITSTTSPNLGAYDLSSSSPIPSWSGATAIMSGSTTQSIGATNISTGTVPGGMTYMDIGINEINGGIPGHTALISNRYYITGSGDALCTSSTYGSSASTSSNPPPPTGVGIGGAVDAFHFCSQQVTAMSNASLTLTGLVVNQDLDKNTVDASSKSGFMLRASSLANSAYVMVGVSPSGVFLSSRASNAGSATITTLASVSAPVWLKLQGSNGTYTGFYSKDNINWTSIGSSTASLTSTPLAGLAVTSNNSQLPITAIFANYNADVQVPQTINFPAIPMQNYGNSPFTLNAGSSSGLPITYNIISGPATISGNTVTLTGVGVVVIAASQSGSANYLAATTVTQSFTVGALSTDTPTMSTSLLVLLGLIFYLLGNLMIHKYVKTPNKAD